MTSEYNRWPDKAGPSRRHFGRAVDRLKVNQPWVSEVDCCYTSLDVFSLMLLRYQNKKMLMFHDRVHVVCYHCVRLEIHVVPWVFEEKLSRGRGDNF